MSGGEITGAQGSNITCIPKIDSTVTEAVWRQRIKDGGFFVKHDPATTTADYLGVTGGVANDATFVGRVIGSTGSGDKFRVTVETEGVRGHAQSAVTTGAFSSSEWGKRMKSDANGKLGVDTSLTAGNVFVVGGTKARPMVAWRWAL